MNNEMYMTLQLIVCWPASRTKRPDDAGYFKVVVSSPTFEGPNEHIAMLF